MDHLFHKNLLQEKHNLEWQLAQANLKIKNLQEQLHKLLTESGGPTITDGNQGSGNVTATPVSPFGPGGYFDWRKNLPTQNPTQNPNQSPTLIPYDGPGPIKPGHYSPAPPPSHEEWSEDWPYPNPDNYPGGATSQEYRRDVIAWERAYVDWLRQWNKWREERAGGAGRYQLPGWRM